MGDVSAEISSLSAKANNNCQGYDAVRMQVSYENRAKLEEELFSACSDGDVDGVRRAIAAGVNPKKAIKGHLYLFPEIPLHIACRYVIFTVM